VASRIHRRVAVGPVEAFLRLSSRAHARETGRRTRALLVLASVIAFVLLGIGSGSSASAADPCGTGGNPISCENSKPGSPPSEWQVGNGADPSIQGFATQMSVAPGQTISFKIKTDATAYRIDIYRLGYYGGDGARKWATINPSVSLPQTQPACLFDSTTRLTDCGNWAVSASWTVPATAVSGIYTAVMTRTNNGHQNQIPFVVRNDSSHSDILFQTADETWQAYNAYGGYSLYAPSFAERAYKVSYNRPIQAGGNDMLFDAEYAMLRWLEKNGYDVSYFSGADTSRSGSQLLNHRLFLSVGHDEYWAGEQRASVEAARAAGVNLGFFSGNEMFWKTRWESSIDGSNTPFRTMVCYKETLDGAKIDPSPQWTGTWRDPRFSPPADGGRPENAVTGTLYAVNGYRTDSLTVPASYGNLRLWRNTAIASLAPGTSYQFAPGTLGYEWDQDTDNGFRPAGLFDLSSTTVTVPALLQDYGGAYASGTATHSLTMYRAASGALVFGAGTVQWSWGLDDNHSVAGGTPAPPDRNMQQATVNLFADMHAQPATLQTDLTPAATSTDSTAPTATITTPANGASIQSGSAVTISGTATDAGGGVVAGVEVSTDGGSTWHAATGRSSWSYVWQSGGFGSVTIKVRAIDDSANIQAPPSSVTVNLSCPCSMWTNAATPAVPASPDPNGVEVGVKFRSDVGGYITGVRFYKGPGNTGTHSVDLWTPAGALLARAPVSGESATGWQTASFDDPVAITANTTYVASYYAPSGNYALTAGYFANSGFDDAPLHALKNGVEGGNGVYSYGSAPTFPSSTYQSSNYWVDVVFNTVVPPDTTPPTVVATTPTAGSTTFPIGGTISASFGEGMNASTISSSTVTLKTSQGQSVPATVSYSPATRQATLTPASSLSYNSTYTATVKGGPTGVKDKAGNALVSDYVWSFTTLSPPTCPCSIWSSQATPANPASSDANAVELGVRFRAEAAGAISGIRFYKGATNTGTHIGSLWTNTGQLLGRATFTNESASGWQVVTFSQPVPVQANTTYVASYFAPAGHYSETVGMFNANGVANPPLYAQQDGVAGANGLYAYTSSPAFPTNGYQSTNYWVDVVYVNNLPADTTPPTIASVSPPAGSNNAPSNGSVSATFNEGIDPSTLTSTNFTLVTAQGQSVPGTLSYDSATNTASLAPTNGLAFQSTYTATVKGGASGVTDLSGNPLASDRVWSFTTSGPNCPCSIWTPSTTPATAASPDPNSVELGVKFRSDVGGYVTGIRFYKGATNTGTHVGDLWTSTGTLLARVTFTNESASGWQTATFDQPVAIQPNTTYVASYLAPAGNYALNQSYFGVQGADNAPLHALRDGLDGANGLYRYSATPAFPINTSQSSNYWVDVVFTTNVPADTTPPTITATSPTAGSSTAPITTTAQATFSEGINPATVTGSTFTLRNAQNQAVAASVSYDATSRIATLTPSSPLANGATYTATVSGGANGVKDLAGNPLASDVSWSFSTVGLSCPCSIWSSSATPATAASADPNSVELGVRFRSDVAGFVTGIRFYKGPGNTGAHVGDLWTNTGTLLARVTFTSESASGWQTASFDQPVAIQANTTYVASYLAPVGRYSLNQGYFTVAGADNPPLHGLAAGVDGPNGLYRYSATPAFPTNTSQSSNYWVDVVFSTTVPPDTTPPTVSSTSPTAGSTNAPVTSTAQATFSEGINAATLTGSTFTLRNAQNQAVAASVSYDATSRIATLTPSSALSYGATYTATVSGGASGVKDLAGNALANDVSWSFTTVSLSCPCSIWSASTTPATAASPDPNSVELGVKFRSDVAGFVTGIRFYKGATNTGTHVGDLWTSSGTLLARVTFTNESAGGWQTATFDQPVAIQANTTYVASYLAPAGNYALNQGYFATAGTDNLPLHALRDGQDGANGLYRYTATPAFPINTSQSGNYWVDVVFSPS
jgi:hypothetical protein